MWRYVFVAYKPLVQLVPRAEFLWLATDSCQDDKGAYQRPGRVAIDAGVEWWCDPNPQLDYSDC